MSSTDEMYVDIEKNSSREGYFRLDYVSLVQLEACLPKGCQRLLFLNIQKLNRLFNEK